MTDTPLSPRDKDEALAAEYVLGVQDLPDRTATEARIKADPVFADLVHAWESRLADLNGDFDEAPAPDLLPRIEARLFPAPPRPPATPIVRFSLPRWLSGVAVAVLLVLGLLTLVPPPGSGLVAVLATADNRLAYEISSRGDSLIVTRTAGVAAVTGQVHELWIIAPGAAPVSLGLLADQPLVVTYPVPPVGWVMAVSVEPAGGSPTGQPTGPVILTAQVTGGA